MLSDVVNTQIVSIPNGMEFYLSSKYSKKHAEPVSIPNGMEFYLSSVGLASAIECFNSQRDGILLSRLFCR